MSGAADSDSEADYLSAAPPPPDRSELLHDAVDEDEQLLAQPLTEAFLPLPQKTAASSSSFAAHHCVLLLSGLALLSVLSIAAREAEWLYCPTAQQQPAPASSSAAPSPPPARLTAAACHGGLYRDGEWEEVSEAWYPYLEGDNYTLSCDKWGGESLWSLSPAELRLHNVSAFPLPARLINSSQAFVRTALKYRWTPNRCQLHLFPLHAPLQFCQALHNRSLLFAGDSTSYQQYQSLIFLLGDTDTDAQFAGGGSSRCRQLLDDRTRQRLRLSSAAPLPTELQSRVQIRWRRNDHLTFVDAGSSQLNRTRPIETPWHAGIGADDIVVLNSGMHVRSAAAFQQQVGLAFSWLQTYVPAATVFWRSTSPGHAECGSPLQRVPLTQAQFASLNRASLRSHEEHKGFGWIAAFNLELIAQSLIGNSSSGGSVRHAQPAAADSVGLLSAEQLSACLDSAVEASWRCRLAPGGLYLMDVYSFDRLRPDAHRPGGIDCLHQCLPGPVDEWNRLLYNLISSQAS